MSLKPPHKTMQDNPPLAMPLPLGDLSETEVFDVVVAGAGGAGMAAALCAAVEGARVLLVESTALVGGTTAFSGGTLWIPGNHHCNSVNPADSVANARSFLDRAVGDLSDPDNREALLGHGAEAVAFMEKHTHVRYRARPFQPDYLSEIEGSTMGGRALEPLPFNGRLLGPLFALVRPPIVEMTVLRGMMVNPDDITHLKNGFRSWASFAHSARLVATRVVDGLLGYSRGSRIVMGNALVGRLLLSLRERNVALLTQTSITALGRRAADSSACTITLASQGQVRTVTSLGGLILASGGFGRHPQRRAQHFPGVSIEWCPGAPGHTGALHDLVQAWGAQYGKTGLTPGFWTPVSLRRRPGGRTAVFPHFVMDRPKPHMLVVGQDGRRFANEATSWHLFAVAMLKQPGGSPAWLITDARGMHKYGLGMVRPGGMGRISAVVDGMGLKAAVADGYVVRGQTLADLARQLGVDAVALQATIARLNGFSHTGVDLDFGRGGTAYERAFGDPEWPGPNPNLGPLERAPYYAVRIYPGDIGAATGLATDSSARVLDARGQPIAGLYACGNDMHSTMGGVYPGPGITIGPGLVFGCLAARDAVARARQARASGA